MVIFLGNERRQLVVGVTSIVVNKGRHFPFNDPLLQGIEIPIPLSSKLLDGFFQKAGCGGLDVFTHPSFKLGFSPGTGRFTVTSAIIDQNPVERLCGFDTLFDKLVEVCKRDPQREFKPFTDFIEDVLVTPLQFTEVAQAKIDQFFGVPLGCVFQPTLWIVDVETTRTTRRSLFVQQPVHEVFFAPTDSITVFKQSLATHCFVEGVITDHLRGEELASSQSVELSHAPVTQLFLFTNDITNPDAV
ncbi:hypothetical protein D9M69_450740 [compost metagenome]